MMFSISSDYQPISNSGQDDEAGDKLLAKRYSADPAQSGTRIFLIRYWVHFTHAVLFLLCTTFFVLWIHTRMQIPTLPEMPFSPANVALEYRQEYIVFNGSFNHPSVYRGPPTPELDAAWYNVSIGVKLARLTREQLLEIGKEDSPSKVKYTEEDGGGYMAALEVTHQLHCLNMLRKYLYYDYYGTFDPFFTESKPDTYRMHLEHCIDNLRQVLMCTADANMITFEWVRGFSTAYPDFNTRHQCRNFEKLIDWQNSNGIHGIAGSHIIRLEGQVDLVHPP
ncbi:hypothetical protein CPB84DRAFT_1740886 [Gymnopilus junonius]|uniref:Tat pathway signal sequence n=1 Tax=Gymnopilus junonius TaxID=109634 RepID=A0A9P5N723_GYMJU|nr:hypothetical protein CPB84DRAFT_1740886 [Gymnopilus junonius]